MIVTFHRYMYLYRAPEGVFCDTRYWPKIDVDTQYWGWICDIDKMKLWYLILDPNFDIWNTIFRDHLGRVLNKKFWPIGPYQLS